MKTIEITPQEREENILKLDSEKNLAPAIYKNFLHQKAYEQGLQRAIDLLLYKK